VSRLPHQIEVCSIAAEVAARAARLFASVAAAAVEERGRFTAALSGGSTPAALYRALAHASGRPAVPWPAVWAFFGDERCVPHDDPRSNFALAHEHLLRHVPLPPGQVVPVPTALPDAAAAAAVYAALLERLVDRLPGGGPPVFDLILLGLGEDGHTASLFPGAATLEEHGAWVVGCPPGTLPPPVDRVTLTLPVLNAARNVIFLVTGRAKAAVLRDVLAAEADPRRLPAAAVRPATPPLWLVDQDAASLLPTGV